VFGPGGDLPASVMVIGGVLILLAVAAVVTALRLMRDLVRLRRDRDAAVSHGAMMDAAASGAPGAFWAWPVDADPDDPGAAGGSIGRLFGPSDAGIEDFNDIIALFGPQGHALRDCVRALRREGTMFAQTAESADGRHTFTARGTRVGGAGDGGGYDVVWFRDISATMRESTSLRARNEELSALNAEYRNTLDLTGIPVWVRNKNLDLVYCNQAFAEVVEESSPAAAVSSGAEISGGPAGWGRELARQAQRDGTTAVRSAHVVANGRRRFMEITELPIGSGDSRWQVLGFAIDRTDTDEMRAALDRHVMAHGEVLESLGTGIVIYGADNRLSFANTAFARLWGLDEDWLKTEPTHGEVLEDLRARRVYPEQTDFQAYKREVMELYTSLIEPSEELLYLPDERVFRVVVNAHPLGGLLMTYEDVTDRLSLERSYNTLIAVQSETLANLHEGVVVFGSDGRIRLFNPGYAEIWNIAPDKLQGEPRLAEIIEMVRDQFLYEGPWEDFRDRLLAGVTDRTPRTGRFDRTDGSVIDFAAVPLPDGAMMFSYLDVTDTVAVQRVLAERNEALLAADRLKSEFITNVSYELRTPLNSIIGFTEILSNEYFGALNDRQSEYAEYILQASRVLLSLIDNILDLALIDAGRLELERSEIKVKEMMDAVLSLTQTQKEGVAVELKCPKNIGTLDGDERRLKQALFNLVLNAVSHTPGGGKVTLAARRRKGEVEFSVSDTGSGIPEADLERIMGRFETGSGRGGGGEGLGLGLALVKSFVELHGGGIDIRSTLGEGTTVAFDIPISGAAGQAPASGGDRESGAA
jgi:signal transduction histidine kinase